MSLEGVYDVPTYSAPEAIDLWSELESAAWSEIDQQNQYQTQVQQWQQPSQLQQPSQSQHPPQQAYGWPNAAPVQEYAAMSHVPEQSQVQTLWSTSDSTVMSAVPMPGDWHQYAQPKHTSKSQTLPVNYTSAATAPVYLNNSANVPVYHNDAASLAVHHTHGAMFPVHPSAWTAGPSQALAGPALYQQTPAQPQCLSSDQINKQAFQTNVGNSTNDPNSPRFHITITPNRTIKKVIKRKRVRTAFTTDQILELENVFRTQTYVTKDDRQAISEKLKISDRAIKVWFQNRRMKGKRESQVAECSDEYETESAEACTEPSTSGDSYGSPNTDLDYIESQIEKSDERGIVTLDDKIMDSILNAVNNVWEPETVDLGIEQVPQTQPIYEPISPPDTLSSAAECIEP